MEKKNIILIVILALIIVIGGYFYYKYYYPYSGNAPAITEDELKCGTYFGFYNDKKPGTPSNWVWTDAGKSSSWHAPNNTNSPMTCNKQLVGGCAGVYYPYWNECCENWANENGIVHAACVGEWVVEDNECVWDCQTGSVCQTDTDCYPEGAEPGTDGGLFYQCIGGKCYEGSSQRSPID